MAHLKRICLIVHPMERVIPEPRQGAGTDKVSLHTHPEPVGKSREGEGCDKNGHQSGHKTGSGAGQTLGVGGHTRRTSNALGLGGKQGQKEECQKLEKVAGARVQPDGPVYHQSEADGTGKEEGDNHDRVGKNERQGSV